MVVPPMMLERASSRLRFVTPSVSGTTTHSAISPAGPLRHLAGLTAPHVSHAQAATTLKFIPVSDLVILDPVWTGARVTRNHGYLVFDTLYGVDETLTVRPQMAAGHTI